MTSLDGYPSATAMGVTWIGKDDKPNFAAVIGQPGLNKWSTWGYPIEGY